MSPLIRRLAFLGLALCAAPAFAQPADVPADADFRRSRVFAMPFTLPVKDRAKTRQVKLFVRPERGGWDVHATQPIEQMRTDPRYRDFLVGEFDVRLDADGVFQFAVMTVFNDGTSEPAGLEGLEVAKRVAVDTQAPSINLRALANKTQPDGGTVVGVEWKIEDPNLARNSIRLEGRWVGQVAWKNFMPGMNPEDQGRQEYTLRQGQRLELRLVAGDRAGNQAWKTILLAQGVGNVTGGSAGSATPGGGPILAQPNYRLVNKTTINLLFRVRERPVSGLEKIELWWTRLGAEWKKLDGKFNVPGPDAETADISFDAPEGDGTYGFIMIATSRAGVASQNPPRANDPPQLWVEVDTKPPEAKLKTVKLANPADGRTVVLEWEATDKNMESLPILFEYAECDPAGNAGKWQELTTSLPNNSRYVCATPQLSAGAYQFRVRMHVFDKAGNVRTVEWDKAVSSDVAKPQVEIFDAKTPKAPATGGAAPGAPAPMPPAEPNKQPAPGMIP